MFSTSLKVQLSAVRDTYVGIALPCRARIRHPDTYYSSRLKDSLIVSGRTNNKVTIAEIMLQPAFPLRVDWRYPRRRKIYCAGQSWHSFTRNHNALSPNPSCINFHLTTHHSSPLLNQTSPISTIRSVHLLIPISHPSQPHSHPSIQ